MTHEQAIALLSSLHPSDAGDLVPEFVQERAADLAALSKEALVAEYATFRAAF